jgi:hypothetical protein
VIVAVEDLELDLSRVELRRSGAHANDDAAGHGLKLGGDMENAFSTKRRYLL